MSDTKIVEVQKDARGTKLIDNFHVFVAFPGVVRVAFVSLLRFLRRAHVF